MLLNISNHPSKEWPIEQFNTANQLFKEVKDLKFPIINPSSSGKEILDYAQDFIPFVLKIKPTAVHIMGEMTFTFVMVQLLERKDIPCYASTSLRKVSENEQGEIIREFSFERFRRYTLIT